ncbi:MAG: sugar phosphate nucleotidyltransferase [Candidatus Ancaeobacter aquaticus]|nr:sugar phosphate nucleotidyltransferase [Candidatus Ancaeobacter aquaticus]
MKKNKLDRLLVSANITLKQAMKMLTETAEKILFVTNRNFKLIGTLTDGDIRRGIIKGVKFQDSIENIMQKKFTSVRSNMQNIEQKVKEMMVKNKCEQIPVLNGAGKIVDVYFWTEFLENKTHIVTNSFLDNEVVIMAGGKGVRLDPFTRVFPKPLIPIGNKPVIEHIMEKFYTCGFRKFLYTLNYKKEYIKLFLKENMCDYLIDWVEENEFLGTAGGLQLLENKLKDTFFVVNCDSLLGINYKEVLEWHKEHNAILTIVGSHSEHKIPYGILEMSDEKLINLSEKPTHDYVINTGIYLMEPRILSYLKKGKYMDMNDLISKLINKEKITVYPIYDGWIDIGQWKEYKNAESYMLESETI